MSFRFDIRIPAGANGTLKGRVDIGPANVDPRTFVFTPTGCSAQPTQSIKVSKSGNTRTLTTCVSPFSITIDSVTYTGLSGTLNLGTHIGSGTLTAPGIPPDPRIEVAWDSTDASSTGEDDAVESEVTRAAAASPTADYGSGGGQ